MKVLVTGGNRGLGAHLVQALGADTISRSTGLDITTQVKEIAEISLQYDVFVNNAFMVHHRKAGPTLHKANCTLLCTMPGNSTTKPDTSLTLAASVLEI